MEFHLVYRLVQEPITGQYEKQWPETVSISDFGPPAASQAVYKRNAYNVPEQCTVEESF